MKIGMMSFAHMHAYSYADSLMKLPNVELVGIYDDNMERGKEVAEKYSTKHYPDQGSFLEVDMDAVIICSENNRHKEMTINAAKAKKHILCEKPIATTVEDAWEMIGVCKGHEVILQTAFPVRFSSPIQQLKRLIDAGELGDIVAFRTTNRGQNPGGWFIDEKLSGGGAVLDHTVHMVDIMRWYLGKEITEVYSIVDSYFHQIDIDDAGILTLQFANGVIASHDASWSRFSEYPTWGDVTIEVIGTKQTVKVDALKEHFRLFASGNQSLSNVFYGNDMDFGLIQDFVECVEQKREPSISGYDGLKALEVALAAYQSSNRKSKVYL
ncbi:Gfo/Idh/MocA family oxidoreductase [Aquibacillus sp. 3ASR75-11]|uniref:Gfo/Idh/MocA family oxidoreductase n=1 Tax=Terrihalobacillus insolitus TaxID=2950438 RepID=A0A9X4AKB9_9BACI|nr:Gfo/Idh/MocA family oxidoreductase [Terrihalobacillus insolitus]MDC3412179.1 Gfo/Idh/MocA family oxidoreductase [Terrihalobacillus insolitus]MDC3423127.1 Gfo/Idh/MocA family oxidoreductase [Terrihalobacillus insolitus]